MLAKRLKAVGKLEAVYSAPDLRHAFAVGLYRATHVTCPRCRRPWDTRVWRQRKRICGPLGWSAGRCKKRTAQGSKNLAAARC